MRITNTFSILFWADQKNTNDDQALLYARITADGKRANLSLKRKIDVSLWDAKKKREKGTSSEARQINLYLDQMHTQLFQYYQDLKFKGELITAQLIKASYGGELDTSKTLQEMIDYHTRKIEGTLAPGTIFNFGIIENYIKRFLTRTLKTTDVFLKQLDYKFICDFETFLHTYWPKGHPKAMNHNTVMKHLQRSRKMVTLAFHMERLENRGNYIIYKMGQVF